MEVVAGSLCIVAVDEDNIEDSYCCGQSKTLVQNQCCQPYQMAPCMVAV